ncbi:MAG: glycosyltransferase [Chitinophagaceae bacterium]|nr:MAG: glycosyltransferase [Chitinophagaceae bacterium]
MTTRIGMAVHGLFTIFFQRETFLKKSGNSTIRSATLLKRPTDFIQEMSSNRRILIYYPFNGKAVAIESKAEMLIRLNYEVFLLTWAPRGELHKRCDAIGVKTFSTAKAKQHGGVLFFVYQTKQLLSFCKKNEIRLLFAHFQSVAMVAGIANYFRKVRVVYFRHNSDYFELRNSRKELFFNKMANKLSETIIAISDNVYTQLLKEGVDAKKIKRINLAYDFTKYGRPDLAIAASIRDEYKANILLLAAARLDALKRHKDIFQVVKALCDKGIDCKLICVGDGPLKGELEKWIEENRMKGKIILKGFVHNVIDYLAACDLLIHLSYSEASNQVVKEAGICRKAVIACKGVGNFEEYLEDNVNAFLVDKESPVDPSIEILAKYAGDKAHLTELGQNLYDTVIAKFDISSVVGDYKALLQ